MLLLTLCWEYALKIYSVIAFSTSSRCFWCRVYFDKMESIEFLFFNCIHLFLAVLGLCSCRGFSLVAVHGLLTAMASVAEHGLQGVWSSAVVARGFRSCRSQALGHRPSSCGAWTYLLHGMCDLPRIGIKPSSPTLAGRFFTNEPPGKPSFYIFILWNNKIIECGGSCVCLPLMSQINLPLKPCWRDMKFNWPLSHVTDSKDSRGSLPG